MAYDEVGSERVELISTCETSGHAHECAVARGVAVRGHRELETSEGRAGMLGEACHPPGGSHTVSAVGGGLLGPEGVCARRAGLRRPPCQRVRGQGGCALAERPEYAGGRRRSLHRACRRRGTNSLRRALTVGGARRRRTCPDRPHGFSIARGSPINHTERSAAPLRFLTYEEER
jgi:hypothetical protein